jgi:hypothetical protein
MPLKSSRNLKAFGEIFWKRKRISVKSLENDDNDRQKNQGWINPLLYNSNKNNYGARLTTGRMLSLCCISDVS